jgi:protoporphyrinogen oxidase
MGRFIHFPLQPLDLLFKLPPRFGVGVARDTLVSLLQRRASEEPETFATLLRGSLGPTLSERFYFPFARKLWGLDAGEISATQARRRIAASTPLRLLRKVANALPGLRKPGAGRFFYPRRGYGQLSEKIAAAATASGALLLPEHRVTQLRVPQRDGPWFVMAEHRGEEFFVEADHVWSTLPITLLPKLFEPAPAPEVLAAAAAITYRAMLLIYLRLPVAQFTPYDAHYLPQADVAITRISEPKNYTDLGAPAGATTLCAELPCDANDPIFRASDEELAAQVAADLARAGMPLPVPPSAVKVMRLAHAYPVYRTGFEQPLALLERWLDTLPRFVSYGRQGLFAHDNTHHALAMAYAAVDCLSERGFDRTSWAGWRRVFSTHVVED